MVRSVLIKTILFFLLYVISCSTILIFAQGISTEGKDFWVGYLANWDPSSSNPVILELYISADDTTSGTVTMPKLASFSPIEFEVYPNTTRKILIPTNLAMASGSNIIENKGVHIETDKNVSVYAMNKRQYSADMTVVLPTYSLGNNYFVLSHWEDGNRNDNANSDSEFLIVGITDTTEIEITPTFETKGRNPPNVPFRITLNKGQTYQVRAVGDLTGSQIVGTNQTGCRDFAVFSGNMYTQVGECNVVNGHDHLYAQMYPTNTLGMEFIVVPLENRYGGDIIKFLATQDNTTITANGSTYQLDAGEFVKILSASVLNVISDQPIAVGQYSRTMDCDGTLGDPFLIPISPNEQLLKKITFNAPSIATLSLYSLNIITKKDEISNITFDGKSLESGFIEIPETEYAYTRVSTAGGNHTIRSNGGFKAYVYGFGHNESFGYATGASLGNLKVDFLVNDQNEKTPIDSLCLSDEISFQVVADTIYTLFNYDFGDGHSAITDKDTAVFHQYSQPGEYLVSLTASTGGDDCSNGNEETSLKIIRVIEPYAKIFGPRSVCPNTTDVEYFLNESNQNNINWFVNGGLINEQSNQKVFIDWGETNSLAEIQLLATNRYGCISDTINYPVKINIQLDPEAPFGPDTLCSNDITNIPYETYFTNVSTYQWKTDFGNISEGNGTNLVEVDWNGYGNGMLWFDQISVTDTVCDGTSDTLLVYIQRNPSEIGNIIVEKDTFLMGEPIHISLDVDTLYQFANWEFDDGTQFDTLNANSSIDHTFQCGGVHKIFAVAYDTGTVCSDTKVFIEKIIYIKPPTIEIINVTKSTTQADALDINWLMENATFYPKK
ncbi:MAG: PKD domain-containing protein, partial [Cyclobacteriaceae bacterium]|nr:PKD domain-containing protein [Cyclobacteriaceae bacterium]